MRVGKQSLRNQGSIMKSVAVFGAFDLVHPGHKAFLAQAKALGDHLTVYLARDEVIQELKGKAPSWSYQQRKRALLALPEVDRVLKGDHALGTYRGICISQPDIIALGYDQEALESNVSAWMNDYGMHIPIVKLEPFKEDIYKTSKLRVIE